MKLNRIELAICVESLVSDLRAVLSVLPLELWTGIQSGQSETTFVDTSSLQELVARQRQILSKLSSIQDRLEDKEDFLNGLTYKSIF